jgi:hypothetical protein
MSIKRSCLDGIAGALLSVMKLTAGIIVVVAAIELAAPGHSLAQAAPSSSVFAVRVVTDDGAAYGTAVLVGREDRGPTTTLYLLTSAALFRSTHSDRIQTAKAVRLELDLTQSVEIEREDVLFVGTGVTDLILLRARTSDVAWVTSAPVVYDPPPLGAVFLISAPDGGGNVKTVAEHVRFESTLLVIGDRAMPVIAQLMGHANVDTTLNVYTQVLDGATRAAVDKIGDGLFTIVHDPKATETLSR